MGPHIVACPLRPADDPSSGRFDRLENRVKTTPDRIDRQGELNYEMSDLRVTLREAWPALGQEMG